MDPRELHALERDAARTRHKRQYDRDYYRNVKKPRANKAGAAPAHPQQPQQQPAPVQPDRQPRHQDPAQPNRQQEPNESEIRRRVDKVEAEVRKLKRQFQQLREDVNVTADAINDVELNLQQRK